MKVWELFVKDVECVTTDIPGNPSSERLISWFSVIWPTRDVRLDDGGPTYMNTLVGIL
jgi:hypothetical protein